MSPASASELKAAEEQVKGLQAEVSYTVSRGVILYHVVFFRVMRCHSALCIVFLVSSGVMWCHYVSSGVMWCHYVSSGIILCRGVIMCQVVSFSIMLCQAVSFCVMWCR